MNRRLAAALAAACLAAPALAADRQEDVHLDGALLALNDQAAAWRSWAEDFTYDLRSSLGTMFAGRVGASRVVKGAPYSAEVQTESNQALADGNVISRKTSGAVYRDGQGRTRQESGGEGKARTVYIHDPVDGRRIVLTPGTKRATIVPHVRRDKQVIRFGGTEIRVEDGHAYLDGKEVTGKVEMNVGSKVVRIDGLQVTVDGKQVLSIPGLAVRTVTVGEDGTQREEVRVQVIRGDDGRELTMPVPPVPPVPPVGAGSHPLPPLPPLPGASVMRFEGMGKLGKGTTTALGTKDFDGVRAEGKKTVWTIPAGEIGNRGAISVTSESWYAPELQVTVYSRYSDPRQGESIYRLAGIKRAEPAPELFRVPEGYETTSREAAREKDLESRQKERDARQKERELKRLDREQQRLDLERERIQRERERLNRG
jgi:hypothetical protein